MTDRQRIRRYNAVTPKEHDLDPAAGRQRDQTRCACAAVPAIRQLALQLAAAFAVLSLAWPYFLIRNEPLPWLATALAIGAVALLAASVTRQPWWWRRLDPRRLCAARRRRRDARHRPRLVPARLHGDAARLPRRDHRANPALPVEPDDRRCTGATASRHHGARSTRRRRWQRRLPTRPATTPTHR